MGVCAFPEGRVRPTLQYWQAWSRVKTVSSQCLDATLCKQGADFQHSRVTAGTALTKQRMILIISNKWAFTGKMGEDPIVSYLLKWEFQTKEWMPLIFKRLCMNELVNTW